MKDTKFVRRRQKINQKSVKKHRNVTKYNQPWKMLIDFLEECLFSCKCNSQQNASEFGAVKKYTNLEDLERNKILQNKCLLAKNCFDTAENEPSKVAFRFVLNPSVRNAYTIYEAERARAKSWWACWDLFTSSNGAFASIATSLKNDSWCHKNAFSLRRIRSCSLTWKKKVLSNIRYRKMQVRYLKTRSNAEI